MRNCQAAGSMSPSSPTRPFVRGEPCTLASGKVGASRPLENRLSPNHWLKRSARRKGQGKPPSGLAVVSQRQAPSPARAAKPPVTKLRRVRRLISRSAASPVSGGSVLALGMTPLLRHQLVTGDHGAEIIPAGAAYLGDVNDKKQHITDHQHEMLAACPGVAAEKACQPGKLCRLVDRQPRHE